MLHCVVFIDILLDDTQQVLTVAEERADATDGILVRVNQILAVLSSDGLDTANTGSHAALAENLEETDATGTAGMDTTAELARRTEAYHTHLVAILLAEEGDGTEFLCLVEGHVAVLVDVDVLANHVVHHALHLSQLVVADFLEVREVEAQRVGADERTLLLHVVAQHLLQGVVQQVGSSMVGGRGITLVGIDASHELRCGVFRQLLDDVDALSVLAFGIDDFDGLVLVAEHTAVSYLTTHLSVERGVVEHQLVELVLLLSHLAVAQDVAVVFGVVIADELLF